MECFRQIYRCIKSPFNSNKGKILEIGPPTNFRKEELPACFSDADTLTSQKSRETAKDETIIEMMEQPPSAREKIQSHVRRMSVKLSRPGSETA